MKIALILAGNEDGGLEKHVIELAEALAENGHDTTLVAHEVFRGRVPAGVRFCVRDLTRSRRDPIALLGLWRTIRQIAPDVIHAHGGKALSMTAAVAPWLKAPLVATVHGQKKRYAGIDKSKAVIAVSHHLAKQIRHPEISVIYNGVSNASVSRRASDASSLPSEARHNNGDAKHRLWLAVGRLVEEKGFDVLIQAFRKVPGSLWIAGDGPRLAELQALIRQQNDQNRIHLLGHRSDVPQLMAQCDALVISSRREGFSYVFAEALLNRCPVVSTDVPVANEILPGQLLCPTDNPEALARLMNRYVPDEETVKSCEAYARAHLTIDAMVTATLKVYTDALQGRPA